MTISTSIKLTEPTATKIQEIGKPYPVCMAALKAYVELYRTSLDEIHEYFTKAELRSIITALGTDVMLSPELQTNMNVFVGAIGNDPEIFEKNKIAWDTLRAKIRRLSSAQIYFLQLKISSINSKENHEKEMGEFISNSTKH